MGGLRWGLPNCVLPGAGGPGSLGEQPPLPPAASGFLDEVPWEGRITAQPPVRCQKSEAPARTTSHQASRLPPPPPTPTAVLLERALGCPTEDSGMGCCGLPNKGTGWGFPSSNLSPSSVSSSPRELCPQRPNQALGTWMLAPRGQRCFL